MPRRMLRYSRASAGLLWLGLLSGCNTISGADIIEVEGSEVTGPELVPADGVVITEVAAYQGVRRSLEAGGVAAQAGVPLVAGRNALVRVFTAIDPSYNGEPVTARLSLGDATPLEVTAVLGVASVEPDLASTVNFEVPGELLSGAAGWRVELLQSVELSSGGNLGAAYPASGLEALPLVDVGPQLRLRLVPIEYRADGSNRLPDVSEAQVALFRDWFYGLYPTPAVTITVEPPIAWEGAVSPFGEGWDELLDAVVGYRYQHPTVEPDEYVYGLFAPDQGIDSFCASGCVAGLSMVAGPDDVQYRAAVGLGFSGADAPETATHETGHMHGRWHAPCSDFGSIDNVDPDYPYADARLGTWGYDLVTRRLFDPEQTADMMSYCMPVWISDYNYAALLERIQWVNRAAALTRGRAGRAPVPCERIAVHRDGSVHVLTPLALTAPLGVGAVAISAADETGPLTLQGSWASYSDGHGGVLTFPRPARPLAWLELEVDGRTVRLSRSQLTREVRPHSTGVL